MNATKLHVNLSQGILEVEGSEKFVENIYQDFKEKMSRRIPVEESQHKQENRDVNPDVSSSPMQEILKESRKSARPKSKKSSTSYGTMLKDLDLTGLEKAESLKNFYAKYVIKTNYERNLVFVYYLTKVRGLDTVGLNHIFTCYRTIPSLKIPGNLKQSLYDTSSRGWIAIESIEDGITVPVVGINHIEHDLTKASVDV